MSEPLYMVVVNTITAQVRAGVRKPGERLPSIVELAAEFDVSPSTIKTALMILRERGVVVGQQGKATYIAQQGRG
ncbi:MAG TPA: winged helix-turn-helix domain-containing protein [Micromonosporaceae bacterium]|jgi:DNA-binding GntR family transcriptional regulator|nr:winged helix-turn-helix domain-containing protein [Micromonosporaceae bacterium]